MTKSREKPAAAVRRPQGVQVIGRQARVLSPVRCNCTPGHCGGGPSGLEGVGVPSRLNRPKGGKHRKEHGRPVT